MNPADLKKLEEYQQEVARLQKGLVKFNQKLVALPGRFGFKTMEEFIAALRQAAGSGEAASAKGKARSTGSGQGRGAKKRKRAKITAEIKAQVKALVKEEKTGAQIAKEVGISQPSVQNIKKELGLVKGKGKG